MSGRARSFAYDPAMGRAPAAVRRVTWVVVVVVVLTGAACSSSDSDDDARLPSATRDPVVVARQSAAQQWVDTYGGGILIDEDADVGLAADEIRCVVLALTDELEQPALDALVAAPSTEALDPVTRDDVSAIFEGCSKLSQRFYDYLVARNVGAVFASCVADETTKVVTWANVLDLGPRAAAGELDTRATVVSFPNEMFAAWTACNGGVPPSSVPF
jgi:hypothetical protein